MPTTVTRIPGLVCPGCHTLIDGQGIPDGGHGPRPGDLTFCVYCGVVLEFAGTPEALTVKRCAVAELPAELQAQIRGLMRRWMALGSVRN